MRIDGARSTSLPQDVLAELCDRLVECGIPIGRVGVFARTLHAEGATDYLVSPMPFTDGSMHVVMSATRHPGGFADAHIEGLEAVVAPLARARSPASASSSCRDFPRHRPFTASLTTRRAARRSAFLPAS
ncbi:MAG: hypothetical protein ABI569_15740 [Casimicrobiaceae bacterium]